MKKKEMRYLLLIVLIFICGFFIGTMVEWFSYKIPREENEPMKNGLKKCYKYARKVINKRTLISILIGIIYCMLYFRYKFSIDFFRYSSVSTILFVVALIDYKTKDVYFLTTAIAALFSMVFIIVGYLNGIDPKTYIFGGILGGIFSAILAALNVIGWGDVEIFIVCGLLAGIYKVAIVAFISIVLCGAYGICILVLKRDKKDFRVAFGPYIIIALVLTII